MGRAIDRRNTCACSGTYLDSNKSRHLKSDKHLNWLATQRLEECSPVNGQQNIMTNEQLIQFKQQVEWNNNYQQELIDKVTTDQGTTDSEFWWDSYDTELQYLDY